MKKYTITAIIAFVICLVGGLLAVGKMKNIEKSEMFVETIEGNVEVAKGLEVTFRRGLYSRDEEYETTELSDHQYHSVIRFGENGTDCTTRIVKKDKKTVAEDREWAAEDSIGWVAGFELTGAGFAGGVKRDLEGLISEQEQETMKNEGAKKTLVVFSEDEYYPIDLSVTIPKRIDREPYNTQWDGTILSEKSAYDEGEDRYSLPKLKDFFRIPVFTEEKWEVSYGVPGDARYGIFSQDSVGKDFFILRFQNAITYDAMYVTFSTHTENDAIVDTSKIPGGYGIYRLPYTSGDENTESTVNADEFKIFHSLDPSIAVDELAVSSDQKTLFLLYHRDGKYCSRLIDIATGECICDVSLEMPDGIDYLKAVGTGEDFFTVSFWEKSSNSSESLSETLDRMKREGRLFVLGNSKDGNAGVLMNTVGFMFDGSGGMAFDGERLVSLQYSRYQKDYYQFAVELYTKNGLEYIGAIEDPFYLAETAAWESEDVDYVHAECWGYGCSFAE